MITLKKDGIYRFKHFEEELDENIHGHNCTEIKVHSFLPYLNEMLEVEDDVTFEDFFAHIMRQKGKYSSIFASHLGNYKLKAWEEEWNRIPVGDRFDGVDYEMKSVGLCWHGESWNYEGEDEITITPEFHGMGIDITGLSPGKEMGLAVEFTPINELKSYPFKLDTQLNVYSLQKDSKILLSGKKDFTVYEVVSTVLYEISFTGTPEQRDARMSKLKQQCEDIKSGKAKTIPAEEVFANLREKLNNLKEEEGEQK